MRKDSAVDLDDRDKRLLRELQREGRQTNAQLAQVVGMSESACLRRLNQLEKRGLIDHYTAVLNQDAAGFPLSVFVTVTLASQSEAALAGFEAAVARVPEVMECYLMTGTADYLLRVVARDIGDLERLHATQLTRMAGVLRVNSSLVMRSVVKRGELPI